MISLCMIVKNEERNLKKCLSSAAQFMDEIIIVDTGSTDKTKIIAYEFTDKVFDYSWSNDFSEARNFSISKATNDWILVLDADECLNEFNSEEISSFINNKSNENTIGRIKRINFLRDNYGCEGRHTEEINRLFSRKHFWYDGAVHEQIVNKDVKPYKTASVGLTAFHTGYTEEALSKTNKLKRNKDLLIKAIEYNNNDPYLFFQLGKTKYMMKDFTGSCFCFEKALTFHLDFRLEYVMDLVETYGYALINSGRYSEALKIGAYQEYYRSSPDFTFLLGLIYMNNAMFKKSIGCFLECTRITGGKMEGISTFLPYYNIGVISEVLGLKDKAVKYYKLCGEYIPAKDRLKLFITGEAAK